MMTVREAADALKVSLGMIYREIDRRRLPCYRIGGAIRISEEHLKAYLDRAETGTHKAPSEFKHVKKIGG